GSSMALNVRAAGHDLAVYDIRREAAAPHLAAGAKWAGSPRHVAETAEVVFTSLPGPREVEAVALGNDGLLGSLRSGAVWFDLTANSPSLVRRLHEPFADRGLALGQAVRQGALGRRRTFDRLGDQFLPGTYEPPDFTLRLAHKDVTLATELARELRVPMRVANLALEELTEALNRGWSERDSRVSMLLQVERSGVKIAVPKEKIQQILDDER